MNTWRTTRDRLRAGYRATGAELPGGDLLGARGVSMDGWFWRISEPATGRVVIALAGLNTPQHAEPWGIVGMAADQVASPVAPRLATARLDQADASGAGVALAMRGGPGHFMASSAHLDVSLDGMHLQCQLEGLERWRGRLGGSSVFQMVPRLNQYWHPWALGGRANGSLELGGESWQFRDAQVYAEKNWGRGGFPTHWWWGQAQGFDDPGACVAFAGGQIHLGRPGRRARLRTEVTAVAVRLPDGRQLRLGNPGTSPVHTTITSRHGTDSWVVRGADRHWRVELEAHAPSSHSFVLPVPLVEEGRLTPGALEHQLGSMTVRVLRDDAVVWQGTSSMAALEQGGQLLAEAELSRRDGSPLPRR